MILDYEPGDKVTNPNNKDWGIGQVQSIINDKVTVNNDKQPIVKSFNIHKYEIEDAVAWRDAKRIELGIN